MKLNSCKTYSQNSTPVLVGLSFVLFVIGVAVHIACGDFPKAIDVLPDERRYLEIARSLYTSGELIIRGALSDFQKILYPLSLFPALMLPSGDAQIRTINILNSVYACSIVFPALAIARKLFQHPLAIAGCMVLALCVPDLMYSMTFMTESLFMPLTLWLIFLCWHTFKAKGRRELIYAICSGILCYITYLCKEVSWMFLIAFVVVYLVHIVQKRQTAKRAFVVVSFFLLGFFVPFIIMKLTLFSGLLNSYSQFSFDILRAPYTVFFSLYAIAVDSVYFIIGFGVFPVIFIACTYKTFRNKERDLALFCLVSLVVGFACVIFTISMREDVGHVALRQHLRYVAPLTLPLLFLFVKQGMRFNPVAFNARPHRPILFATAIVAFCILVCEFFGTANLSQGFDNSQFHFLRWLINQGEALSQDYFSSWYGQFSSIATDDGALLTIEPLNWLSKAAVIAFTVGGTVLLMNRRRTLRTGATLTITTVIAIFMLANSICAFNYNRNAYDVKQSDIDEICTISNQLASRNGTGEVVIVLDESNTGSNNLIDTYLQDGEGNYHYIQINALDEYVRSSFTTLVTGDPIEYVLVNNKQHINSIPENSKIIDDFGKNEGRYILYHIDEAARKRSEESDLISRITKHVVTE